MSVLNRGGVLKCLIFLKSIFNFLKNLLISHERIDEPLLYMTILAKDEIDVIEKQIIFHRKMGVDGFIVTDNNSTDGTREVFERYLDKGWIKEIIIEKSSDYSQVKWVDRMISIARDKYNADWVINADADEFWYSAKHDLKHELKGARNNIFKVNIYNVLPENEKCFFENISLIDPKHDLSDYDLSKFSIYGEQIPKVIHRSKGYKLISMGNHSVEMVLGTELLSDDITIFHYSLRSEEHFKRKMINGGASVERAMKQDKKVAVHWMYYYKLLQRKDVDVKEEYRKVVGSNYLKEFQELGLLFPSDGVRNILRELEVNASDDKE